MQTTPKPTLWIRILGFMQFHWAVFVETEHRLYIFNAQGTLLERFSTDSISYLSASLAPLGFLVADEADLQSAGIAVKVLRFNFEQEPESSNGPYQIRFKNSQSSNPSTFTFQPPKPLAISQVTVVFDRGNFYDKQGNLVAFEQGRSYTISGEPESFFDQHILLDKLVALPSDKKYESIAQKHSEQPHVQILDAGTPFEFIVSLRKKDQADTLGYRYPFKGVLEEDLYLYRDQNMQWRACECICRVVKCENNSLSYTYPIQARTLNDLFGKTVAYYFAFKRSQATNIYNTFSFQLLSEVDKLLLGKENVTLQFYRELFKQFDIGSSDTNRES